MRNMEEWYLNFWLSEWNVAHASGSLQVGWRHNSTWSVTDCLGGRQVPGRLSGVVVVSFA